MPTYEYECTACGTRFELFQRITEAPRRKCPHCRRLKARRLIGPGAAVLFKGAGFYQTDYRSAEYKKRAKEEQGHSAGASEKKKEKKDGGASGTAGSKAVE